ncbi:MAG: hypothetical protein JWL80_29 [Parcubacteria group bacterium]|nr:hypothetical protein [Parcubacteria group bacterium]
MITKKSQSLFWRYTVNFWTVLLFIIIIRDFMLRGALENLLGPAAAIYVASLAVYSAEKEFERWQDYRIGRHPGEIYVVLWTLLLFGLFVADYLQGSDYKISSEVISTYIVVLGILALTKRSKNLFIEKHNV